jgi:hypothetical protein
MVGVLHDQERTPNQGIADQDEEVSTMMKDQAN